MNLKEFANKYNLAEDDLLLAFLQVVDFQIDRIEAKQDSINKQSQVLLNQIGELIGALKAENQNIRLQGEIDQLQEVSIKFEQLVKRAAKKTVGEISGGILEGLENKIPEIAKKIEVKVGQERGLGWRRKLLNLTIVVSVFLVGQNWGTNQTIGNLETQRERLRGEAVERAWRLVQVNPELLNCRRPGWKIVTQGASKLCLPHPDANGITHGWLLPN